MLGCWNHVFVSLPVIGRKRGVLAVAAWNPSPELACTLPAAVANIEGDDLFGLRINGDPDPLLVRFAADETPHFIGFRFESQELDTPLGCAWQLHIEVWVVMKK